MNKLFKLKNIFKKENGSMMIEAVVGLTLITVGLLGVFTLVTNSIKTNRAAGYRFIAANLAAEGIEITKNIIDANVAEGRAWNAKLKSGYYDFRYDDFYDNVDEAYLGAHEPGQYFYKNGMETIFKRKVIVLYYDHLFRIISEVDWDENGDEKEIRIEDNFYNWRNYENT